MKHDHGQRSGSKVARVEHINLPGTVLYKKQHEALFDPRRITCIESTTKAGKTVGAIAWQFSKVMASPEGDEQDHWWVAPSYAQAKMAFRLAWKNYFKSTPATPTRPARVKLDAIGAKQNKSDLAIIAPTGTRWTFKTAENPELLYGEAVYSIVIDEASRCKDAAIVACRTTTTVTRGQMRLIGNVHGRHNLHYQWSRKGEAGEPGFAYHRITADDAVAAGVFRQSDIESARRGMPHAIFREIYYCEPADDGANPFGVDSIAKAVARQGGKLAPGPARIYGVDVARARDWTVVVGLNGNRDVCTFERFHGGSLDSLAERIAVICNGTPGFLDSTGVGDAVFEMTQKRWPQVRAFVFSNASKQGLMEGLAVGLQGGRVGLIDGVLRSEMEAFEYTSAHASGRHVVRYEAPPGAHDDAVCAMALAWHGAEVYGIAPSAGGVARAIVVPVPGGGGVRPAGRSSGRW